MKRILMLAAVFALASGAAYAKSCTDPTTHKFIKCPAPAASPMSSTSKAPNCKVGVPCGKTCIAKGKVCHIK